MDIVTRINKALAEDKGYQQGTWRAVWDMMFGRIIFVPDKPRFRVPFIPVSSQRFNTEKECKDWLEANRERLVAEKDRFLKPLESGVNEDDGV